MYKALSEVRPRLAFVSTHEMALPMGRLSSGRDLLITWSGTGLPAWPPQEKANRGQEGQHCERAALFISLKMLGKVFDTFVFSFLANTECLL